MEDILQNCCWVDSVAEYAVAHGFMSKHQSSRWAERVRSREIIGTLMREIAAYKAQGKSKVDIFNLVFRCIKDYPGLMHNIIFIKKMIFNV